MKEKLQILFKVIGVILVLCGVYIIFQTQFVVSVDNGIMYDGFGQKLNDAGEHIANKYTLLTYILIGGGIGIFKTNVNKKGGVV